MSDNSGLFRKKALEHISSPEQLDTLLEVLPRRSWLPLLVLGLAIFGVLVWSVVGQIPIDVEAEGVLVHPRRVVPIQAPTAGPLISLHVQPGDHVTKDQVIGEIDQPELSSRLELELQKLENLKIREVELKSLRESAIAEEERVIDERLAWLSKKIEETRADLTPRWTAIQSYLDAQESNNDEQELALSQFGQYLADRLSGFTELIDAKYLGEFQEDFIDAKRDELQNNVAKAALKLEQAGLEYQRLQLDLEQRRLEEQIAEWVRQRDELAVQRTRLLLNEEIISKENQLDIDEADRRVQQLAKELETRSRILSPHDGMVLEIRVIVGEVLTLGESIGSVENQGNGDGLFAIAYYPAQDGKKIDVGMATRITPTTVKRERYGSIVGRVTSVSPLPRSTAAIAAVLGNAELAARLGAGGAMIEVRSSLEAADTPSGYAWSSGDGPELQITSGTTLRAHTTIESRRPITFVLPFLRDLSGH